MSSFNYALYPATQCSSPLAAKCLRRAAAEAIKVAGYIVNIYSLISPNIDNLYNDRYEKGAVYANPVQMKVGCDWGVDKDLTKYLALYLEKDLPMTIFVPSDVTYPAGSRVEFPYNLIGLQSFTTNFKIVQQISIGSPFVILTAFSIAPQRF